MCQIGYKYSPIPQNPHKSLYLFHNFWYRVGLYFVCDYLRDKCRSVDLTRPYHSQELYSRAWTLKFLWSHCPSSLYRWSSKACKVFCSSGKSSQVTTMSSVKWAHVTGVGKENFDTSRPFHGIWWGCVDSLEEALGRSTAAPPE